MQIIPNTVKLFDMPDDLYFGKGLPGYISNSKMGLINPSEGGSATKYVNGFDLKTDSLALGSAVHQLVLEREKYQLAEVEVPSDGPRKIINTVHKLTTREDNPIDFDEALNMAIQIHNYYKGKPGEKRTKSLVESTKQYYDFLCNNNTENTIFLNTAMKERCVNALAAIDENLEIERLLNPKVDMATATDDVDVYNEHVMTCQIIFNGSTYHLKLKADNFTVNHTKKVVRLNDLKTTSFRIDNFMGIDGLQLINFSLEPVGINGSFQKYHYYRQMYMYSTIVNQWVKDTYGDDYEMETNMLVVETLGFKPKAAVFSVDEHWMEQGRKEFMFLMELIDKHENPNKGKIADDLGDEEDVSSFSVDEDDLDGIDDFEDEEGLLEDDDELNGIDD